MKKHILLLGLFSWGFLGGLEAQENTDSTPVSDTSSWEWGLNTDLDYSSINLNAEALSDYLTFNSYGVFRFGGFLKKKQFESKFTLGPDGMGGEIKYHFHPMFFSAIDLNSVSAKNLIDHEKVLFNYYTLGIGTKLSYRKIVFEFKGLLGNALSETHKAFRYAKTEQENKIAEIRKTSKLDKTPIYGGSFNIYFRTVQRHFFHNSFRTHFFFSIDYMANRRSDFYRSIEVSEWIASNVVYEENTDKKEYSLELSRIRFGVRWQF